jgi:hypothetical protein
MDFLLFWENYFSDFLLGSFKVKNFSQSPPTGNYYFYPPNVSLYPPKIFHSKKQVLIFSGNMANYGLDPKIKKSTHPTRNSEILPLIKSGHLRVKGNIKKLERGQVVFEDGSKYRKFQEISYTLGSNVM